MNKITYCINDINADSSEMVKSVFFFLCPKKVVYLKYREPHDTYNTLQGAVDGIADDACCSFASLDEAFEYIATFDTNQ